MTATLMFERINTHRCSLPSEEKQPIHRKSYYKFYQLELRQLLTENRLHQEHDAKSSKQKQSKSQLNNKRLHKEEMDRIQEKTKKQLRISDNDKRSSSILSVTNRGTKDSLVFTITSTNISTTSTTESRQKSILKTKQPSPLAKPQGVGNTLTINQTNIPPKTPMIIPRIEIDDTDDSLSKSNATSYTQVSSSSQNLIDGNHTSARQSTLRTILSHLNSYTSSDIPKWNLYRDFDSKISTSISPKVYQNFERIIL